MTDVETRTPENRTWDFRRTQEERSLCLETDLSQKHSGDPRFCRTADWGARRAESQARLPWHWPVLGWCRGTSLRWPPTAAGPPQLAPTLPGLPGEGPLQPGGAGDQDWGRGGRLLGWERP